MTSVRFLSAATMAIGGFLAVMVSCSSFGGSDATGPAEEARTDAGVLGASDAASMDAAGSIDAPSDGSSVRKDAGLAPIDLNLCSGTSTLVVNESFGSTSGNLTPAMSGCTAAPTYPGSALLIECSGKMGDFDVLATVKPLPDTAAAVNLRFEIVGTVNLPTHVFAQLVSAAGPLSNLAFTYDPSKTTVLATVGGGTVVAQWTGVSKGFPHLLRIGLPPAADPEGGVPGAITLELDGIAGTSAVNVYRQAGPIQVGPYLSTADGDAKDRYLALRAWSCP